MLLGRHGGTNSLRLRSSGASLMFPRGNKRSRRPKAAANSSTPSGTSSGHSSDPAQRAEEPEEASLPSAFATASQQACFEDGSEDEAGGNLMAKAQTTTTVLQHGVTPQEVSRARARREATAIAKASSDVSKAATILRCKLQRSLPGARELEPLAYEGLNKEYPSLTEFKMVRTLGVGAFARVSLVLHTPSDTLLALKSLKKLKVLRLKQLQHVLSEKSVLAKVKHPFIVQLRSAYQDTERLHMLIDYVPGGELFKHLREQPEGRFATDVTRFYAASAVLALSYLHANNIIYRDLKPENLLLDDKGFLKMTDFGFAKELYESDGRTWTLCGTPEYLAPEIVRKEGHGAAADWWSLGILLYEMSVGHPPFRAARASEVYKLILAAEYTIPDYVDLHAKDMIAGCLQVDVAMRLGTSPGGSHSIKRHPFFTSIDWKDLLTGKIQPPIQPIIEDIADQESNEAFPESVDDPSSPILDLKTAERIFRGF